MWKSVLSRLGIYSKNILDLRAETYQHLLTCKLFLFKHFSRGVFELFFSFFVPLNAAIDNIEAFVIYESNNLSNYKSLWG